MTQTTKTTTRKGHKEVSMTLSHGSTFGEFSRYQLVRHESHRGQEFSCWMVLDAERPDELTGMPGIVRQAATIEEAVAGLR